MENHDYIFTRGRLAPLTECGAELAGMMRSNYTYRTIHTKGHRPLHLSTQLELLSLSYRALYGTELNPDHGETVKNIADLLYRNNASTGSNLVRIAALPGEDEGKPETAIFFEGPLVYPGYSIWHKPAAAMKLPYEIPFPVFKTSANALCHSYARDYAARKGYGEVISENFKGEAVSAGENPLFAIAGRQVYVADAEVSSPQSVERLAGIYICGEAGLTVNENGIPASALEDMDELFSFTPQGILPIGRTGGRLYPSTMVHTFDSLLSSIEGMEFL